MNLNEYTSIGQTVKLAIVRLQSRNVRPKGIYKIGADELELALVKATVWYQNKYRNKENVKRPKIDWWLCETGS